MSRIYLSKSKILSGAQCEKRLYLEVHHPELLEVDEAMAQRFAIGHRVGEVARRLWPDGILIGHDQELVEAIKETKARLAKSGPVTLFEATLEAGGVLIRADMLQRDKEGLRLVEVKAATQVKDYYLLDVAVQSWVLEQAGFKLDRIELAHVDNTFVYPGNDDYDGLLAFVNVKGAISELRREVPALVTRYRTMLDGDEPDIAIGKHCTTPYACPFINHCTPPQPEYPVTLLPYGGKTVQALLADGYDDLRNVPADRLTNPNHQRVWRVTRSGKPELLPGAKKVLKAFPYPRYYMDFETVQFPVPIWKGTRPYEALPFQWSVHIESKGGDLDHHEFLDTEGDAPMLAFCESLLEAVGTDGPVFVYNASFEKRILAEQAARYRKYARDLKAVIDRVVDLLPITRDHYYHPAMKGSWSIKAVAPTVSKELDYGNLGNVQTSSDAPAAYIEMLHPETAGPQREQIAFDLHRYCGLDTFAMIKLARLLSQ